MVAFQKLPPAELAARKPLGLVWPGGFEIPIIGVTGEYASGKTLFGLTIDPKNTIVVDAELGSKTYESSMGFTRVDVPQEMGKLYPKGDHQPIHVFMWWRKLVSEIEHGRFSVMVIDDISSIEQGLVSWVRGNPQHFGKTAIQYQKSEAMMWGDVKNLWKSILADLSTRVQTLVIIAHMRHKFAGNIPTKEREAKGLDTIMELATLYLELRRNPDGKGNVPAKPIARVVKNRLIHSIMGDDGELQTVPVLTPFVPDCTPARIRHLMLNPVDYAHLKASERVQVDHLTDDERLERQAQIAADSRAAAEAARDRAAIEAGAQATANAQAAAVIPAPDFSAQWVQDKLAKAQAAVVTTPQEQSAGEAAAPWEGAANSFDNAAGQSVTPTPAAAVATASAPASVSAPAIESAPSAPPATEDQLKTLAWIRKEGLKIEIEKWRAMLAKNYEVDTATKLSEDEANQLIAALQKKMQERQMKVSEKEWVNQNVMQGATAGQ